MTGQECCIHGPLVDVTSVGYWFAVLTGFALAKILDRILR